MSDDSTAPFEVGSIVLLKSGGPSMTVVGDENTSGQESKVFCSWFDGGKCRRDRFPRGALKSLDAYLDRFPPKSPPPMPLTSAPDAPPFKAFDHVTVTVDFYTGAQTIKAGTIGLVEKIGQTNVLVSFEGGYQQWVDPSLIELAAEARP